MKKEIKSNINELYQHLKKSIDKKIPEIKVPKFIRKLIVGGAFELLKLALDLNYVITMPFTPLRYDIEMKGMARASGVDYKDIRRLNLFPEITKAACSIAGVWGNASKTGKLLQLRALDWDKDSPVT
jgi:hypothetical protein